MKYEDLKNTDNFYLHRMFLDNNGNTIEQYHSVSQKIVIQVNLKMKKYRTAENDGIDYSEPKDLE